MTPWDHACRFLRFKSETQRASIHERVTLGLAHLWCGEACAGVTEVTDEGTLHIWEAGGSMSELLRMLPAVEAFARSLGCVGLEIEGRKGWRRVFPKYGFAFDGERLIKFYV